MIHEIRELCDEHEMLMIVDETISGFRFGLGGAQRYLDFTPDLAILGPSIVGGMPFGVLMGREGAMERALDHALLPTAAMRVHPLSLISAQWCLDELSNMGTQSANQLMMMGRHLMTGLRSLAQRLELPLYPQGPGPMFHTLLTKTGVVAGHVHDYRDFVLRNDNIRWAHLRQCLLRNGLLVTESGQWFLSFAHTRKDLDGALDCAERAFMDHMASWE